ncbi:nucleoside diphosphate kinase-Z6 [Coemansia reversa NRRL 1564]|uniref:Nucleoside diphosphate kinase n=1 Tax=Coemansia reversa (strain ATCC 12441 / NRRL 1564) TaxID=763665 RepID=A0A2G5BLA9_COERN|nr:nucleoside diphosphate kinase-Z6 [Coemansia reversa NRRL 1564]|eukprot:PIA19752.1 nucleoside diphosphate kinase-Z6 [Coemansia reversa NRRL 1564]
MRACTIRNFSHNLNAVESTLALIKPDLLADPQQVKTVENEIQQRFKVSQRKQVFWKTEEAQNFYQEHQGKLFFNRLIGYMTSGPLIALALTGPHVISEWRLLMGQTRPPQMRVLKPETLRARFGLTDTRNSFHGSDSVASARRELAFFFGPDSYDRFLRV